MLKKKEKINIFRKYLNEKNTSYADIMKDELYVYFFQNENCLDFLNVLSSENEITDKTDFLIAKMIMHEDEDSLDSIIEIHA